LKVNSNEGALKKKICKTTSENLDFITLVTALDKEFMGRYRNETNYWGNNILELNQMLSLFIWMTKLSLWLF
jgi:hypothetical protein